jgi:hypothetical protein
MKMKLNLGGKDAKGLRRVKPWQAIVGVIALVMVPTLGNTFAGSITVNTAQNVEFGQGIASTAACDSNVTITPYALYDATQAGYFLDTITVSNIELRDTSTVGAGGNYLSCLGKTFKLQVLNGSNVLKSWVTAGVNTGSATVNSTSGTNTASGVTTGLSVVVTGSGSTTGSIEFGIDSTTILSAGEVTKILIQTQ